MSLQKILPTHQHSLKERHEQPQNISYSVVHAIPGRIRFRIPRLSHDTKYTDKLKQAIELHIQDAQVRVNPMAASIVINYDNSSVSDEQVRSHLINLIQTAPEIKESKPVAAKSALAAIFDSLINLINGVRNLNQASNTIQHHPERVDTWEKLLSTGQKIIKGLKSTLMFILPGKRPQSSTALETA
ncbi:HMA2 domain-containing protein [Anabaena azotica]|uniref:Uncharacterized protein n=1 Tax=Anabaena azotica FACHB-119 TaxID=947527 RepID=A0ABR8DGU8_9NOST|nr:hypothetical protein [Anabaena azotica]MBD2505417.1 hypothetical protein [Anabaena azotica FACHB-119]